MKRVHITVLTTLTAQSKKSNSKVAEQIEVVSYERCSQYKSDNADGAKQNTGEKSLARLVVPHLNCCIVIVNRKSK